MMIPNKYEPQLLTEKQREGYLNWSLDFFTKTDVLQSPYVDITLQLNVTKAYKLYESVKNKNSTFFAFLIWNLAQTLPKHFDFNLRLVEKEWYVIKNPPIVVPVAVGGKDRFCEMVLENVNHLPYDEFITEYSQILSEIRNGNRKRVETITYLISCFIGNLPNLQFTGLTLHWQKNHIEGQPMFYFGKRYWQENELYIPFAAKLHHSTKDPFVLDLLIQDFQNRFNY